MMMIAKAENKLGQKKRPFGSALAQSKAGMDGKGTNLAKSSNLSKMQDKLMSTTGTIDADKNPKRQESNIEDVLPASHDAPIPKLFAGPAQANPYTLDSKDMGDFRVPVKIFRQYSSIMKNLNNDVQKSFLRAMGVDLDFKQSKIGWEKFVELNCLMKFNTATLEEQIDFFVRVIDPQQQRIVP